MEEFKHCQYRVNDPLENIPYDLTFGEFKRYCEAVNPLIIAPGGEYRKPTGGCRLIQTIATSRAFNRYRGLFTKQTLKYETFSCDDMVQEAFMGMLLYKDDFTGEPGEVIFKAIRKHFKIQYREANGADRDLDNGRHNARIEPRSKPPKVLIDELDYDPAKEPESVKQANNIKNWRIGGITIMNGEIERRPDPETGVIRRYMNYKKPMNEFELKSWEMRDKGTIYFFDEEPDQYRATRTCKKHKIIKTGDREYVEAKRTEHHCLKRCGHFRILCDGTDETIAYKRTQTAPTIKKLKIGKEKAFTQKRNDPLELVSLLHAGFYPEAEQAATDEQIAKQLNVLPSMLKYWRARFPGFYPVYFPPGAIVTNRFADTSYIDDKLKQIAIYREALLVINAMPEPQASIMKLYYYQGLNQAEICALLHKSTRKVQLAKEAGLQTIKQHIKTATATQDDRPATTCQFKGRCIFSDLFPTVNINYCYCYNSININRVYGFKVNRSCEPSKPGQGGYYWPAAKIYFELEEKKWLNWKVICLTKKYI